MCSLLSKSELWVPQHLFHGKRRDDFKLLSSPENAPQNWQSARYAKTRPEMEERDICTNWVVSTELEGTVGLILVPRNWKHLNTGFKRKASSRKWQKGGPRDWLTLGTLSQSVQGLRVAGSLQTGKGLSVVPACLVRNCLRISEIESQGLRIVLPFPAIRFPLSCHR